MLFRRLVCCALLTALVAGSLQWALMRWQALPIILAAETFEDQKAAPPVQASADHHHEAGAAHQHAAEAEEWTPVDGFEREAWTWLASVFHVFALALLLLAAMGAWVWRRGTEAGLLRIGALAAAAGWLSLHLWPALGLPAEIPGMDAADLHARQSWWVLAAASAATACAVAAFGRTGWRWLAAVALLALPFLVGAPGHAGDPLAGFDGEAHARLAELGYEFVGATLWLSLALWAGLGLAGAASFARWVAPVLPQAGAEV